MTTTGTIHRTPARALRWSAAAATLMMSLINLPFAFADGGLTKPLAWLVTLLGVAALIAAVALLRNASRAPEAVTVIGAVNLAGAIAALAGDQDGAIAGLVLSVAGLVLGVACLLGRTR